MSGPHDTSVPRLRQIAEDLSAEGWHTIAGTIDQLADEIEWRPINTCPKNGKSFLCGWFDEDYWWVVTAFWANGVVDGGWNGAKEPVDIKPTHWMPLPRPPK